MDKRYAIFDLDGTLADSMGWWQKVERDFLSRRGITGDVKAVLEEVKPLTLKECARIFIREYQFDENPEVMAAEMQNAMEQHYRRDVPLKSGMAELVTRLREAGVVMCVASATAEPLMRACLTRLGIADAFAFMISCMEVGVGKVRPDVYLEAARRFGAEPGEIAVYEDAPYALRTAKNAGFYTVGVYDESGAAYWEEITRTADELLNLPA